RGYVAPGPADERLWTQGCAPALFFSAERTRATSADVALRTSDGEVAASRSGSCTYVAPHVGQTLALMMLGRSVENDAVGPGDGTVTLEDGVARAEDGTNLLFATDRSKAVDQSKPAFLFAHADTVRSILVNAVYEAIEATGIPAYATWRWPKNCETVSTVTVDCDEGDQYHVMDVVRSLINFGQPACWLSKTPGLPQEVCRLFKNYGHCTGLLFRYDSPQALTEQIRSQAVQITRSTGSPVRTFRPDDGKWTGLTRVYEAALEADVPLCVAKGGVQPGSTGFPFGTCNMFFPVSPQGARIGTAELPYAIHRPGEVTSLAVAHSLIEETVRQRGCLHTSVRLSSAKAQEPGLVDLLMRVREAKFGMFTTDALVQYEKGRRSLRVDALKEGVRIVSPYDLSGLTLMLFGGGWEIETSGRQYTMLPVTRHGTLLSSIVLDVPQRTQTNLFLSGRLAA
ncbi:MAG TPA: hypothetical protein VNI20_10345, partial [Fimbriimonadaceae bacterium]|nr:hypothetical protein [Fimbriimonadaceae bacterium]